MQKITRIDNQRNSPGFTREEILTAPYPALQDCLYMTKKINRRFPLIR